MVNPHAILLDIGIGIKPFPIRLNVLEFDVVTVITNVSNDFSNKVIVFYFFLDL